MRGIYLSGAPRLSTRADTESLGPRAHILGVLNALRSAGVVVDDFIAGDRVPAQFSSTGSEGRLGRNRLTVLAADIMRLALRLRSRRQLARESRDRTHDFAYERYALFQELGSRLPSGTFWVLEVNALLAKEATSERRATTSRRLAESFERRTFQRADLLVAVTHALKDQIVSAYGIAPERIVVVENGVDVSRYEHLGRTSRSIPRRVGFLGALYPWQNLDALVSALAGTDLDLDIAGDGPERNRLDEIIAANGLQDRVRFHGRVSPDDVPSFLDDVDICFAGHASANGVYFSPLKLWEYLAAGKVVVASRHHATEALENAGFPILTYEGDDAEAIERAMRSVATDFGSYVSRAEESASSVRSRFSWEARIQPVLDLITERADAR